MQSKIETNTNVTNAVGYQKENIEAIVTLLNNIPVKTFLETQAKYKIYEILMNPDYEFQPPTKDE